MALAAAVWHPYDKPARLGRWQGFYIVGSTVRTRAVERDGVHYIARLDCYWSFRVLLYRSDRVTQDILHMAGNVAAEVRPGRALSWHGVNTRANLALEQAGYTLL